VGQGTFVRPPGQALTPPVLARRPSKTMPAMEVPGRPPQIGKGSLGRGVWAAAQGRLLPVAIVSQQLVTGTLPAAPGAGGGACPGHGDLLL